VSDLPTKAGAPREMVRRLFVGGGGGGMESGAARVRNEAKIVRRSIIEGLNC